MRAYDAMKNASTVHVGQFGEFPQMSTWFVPPLQRRQRSIPSRGAHKHQGYSIAHIETNKRDLENETIYLILPKELNCRTREIDLNALVCTVLTD